MLIEDLVDFNRTSLSTNYLFVRQIKFSWWLLIFVFVIAIAVCMGYFQSFVLSGLSRVFIFIAMLFLVLLGILLSIRGFTIIFKFHIKQNNLAIKNIFTKSASMHLRTHLTVQYLKKHDIVQKGTIQNILDVLKYEVARPKAELKINQFIKTIGLITIGAVANGFFKGTTFTMPSLPKWFMILIIVFLVSIPAYSLFYVLMEFDKDLTEKKYRLIRVLENILLNFDSFYHNKKVEA